MKGGHIDTPTEKAAPASFTMRKTDRIFYEFNFGNEDSHFVPKDQAVDIVRARLAQQRACRDDLSKQKTEKKKLGDGLNKRLTHKSEMFRTLQMELQNEMSD